MLVALLVWRLAASGGESAASGSVGCSTMEQLSYHVHAHLTVFIDGQPLAVPANVGIRPDCISWLHTHDASGILHIEAPTPQTYTLGQFFAVWGQQLDASHFLGRLIDAEHPLVAFVNGHRYDGAPASLPLDAHAVIVLEYGTVAVSPPPFSFPAGL